jgi:hypothetical protein
MPDTQVRKCLKNARDGTIINIACGAFDRRRRSSHFSLLACMDRSHGGQVCEDMVDTC